MRGIKRERGGKLDAPTDGPFTIAECLGKGTYRLEGRSQKVNGKHLRTFLEKFSPGESVFERAPEGSQCKWIGPFNVDNVNEKDAIATISKVGHAAKQVKLYMLRKSHNIAQQLSKPASASGTTGPIATEKNPTTTSSTSNHSTTITSSSTGTTATHTTTAAAVAASAVAAAAAAATAAVATAAAAAAAATAAASTIPGKATTPATKRVCSAASIWLPSLGLSHSDRSTLLDRNAWLNDNHMRAVIDLYNTRYSQRVSPMQDSVFCQHPSFFKAPLPGKNCFFIFYFLFFEHSTQDYVGFPFFHIHAFKITIPRVHQQTGGADCGLFAIANAVELAEGGCPRNVTYNQERMRVHLILCLEKKQICQFPYK